MLGKAQSERGMSFARAALLMVFALQAPLQFVVALPVAARRVRHSPARTAGRRRASCWRLSASCSKASATRSSCASRPDPATASASSTPACTALSHAIPIISATPCVWWGLYLNRGGRGSIGLWSLPGPVLLTFLLTRWSGMPTVEGRMRRKKKGL
ncbi:MAG: DUF1295 domain-containing protein [Rhizomicrobium sp.]